MKNFVGIDLGTTNSAISTYDGTRTRIWKSPEQNDVTPSAIFFDSRGNKHLGLKAYNSAPWQPESSATLFKRIMGTSTPVNLPAVNRSMTPEECSSEILKLLFGYLPEEMRNDSETGTVITVPAAFNQMQKDATVQASQLAGIGSVALMQEPVAAVMSVMRSRSNDGMFLIYDLGGGTLDIAIAESTGGHVNLLSHGGIARCGGQDFDRVLMDNVVKPWLLDNFRLPADISVNPDFKKLLRVASWATEKAKIELSAKEDALIMLSEDELRCRDLDGKEIYLEVPLSRDTLDKLIAERIEESVEAARDALSKATLSPHDLECIVFVGGPTKYKPLRDRVSFELGIPGNTDVDPMTAVAEGASLFAESIDWGTRQRSRKSSRGQISPGGDLAVNFSYTSRTPDKRARIAAQLTGSIVPGAEFQIESLDTGWTSGRLSLENGAALDVTLPRNGEHTFKVFVFDSSGGPMELEQDRIVITRTTATVDAIPASHSICVEALNKLGGKSEPVYLVRAGESLPVKGKQIFKAGESLKAGSSGSLNFKLYEGEISPITDNRHIGAVKISGSDFSEGVIPAGAKLECEFEILDSGTIYIEISVPDIRETFNSGKNFYSRQGIGLDYSTDSARVRDEGTKARERLDEISNVVNDPKLDQARQKLEAASRLNQETEDMETTHDAMERVHEARKLIADVTKNNLKEIRQIDLDRVAAFFDDQVRRFARPSEATSFDNLTKTAQRSITRNDSDFEKNLDELRGRNFEILWRQDWFVVQRFHWMTETPHRFIDRAYFDELSELGAQYIQSDNIDGLRNVVSKLYGIQVSLTSDDDISGIVNIIKG